MMKAVSFVSGCSASDLSVKSVPQPILRKEDVILNVKATAINRADILQRKGFYPPPSGESDILGLEATGIITEIGQDIRRSDLNVGDKVMALLPGGGNAEFVSVNAQHVMSIPKCLSMTQAAAIPEVWITSFQLLNRIAQIKNGEKVLIHAGASGVGTAAVQLVTKMYGGIAFVTAGSEEKCKFVKDLGAQHVINYKEKDFAQEIEKLTGGTGVDVVLDCIGGIYWEKNVKCLAIEGRWVLYGLLGGGEVNGNILAQVLSKRIRLEATTLRARTNEYKSSLIADFEAQVIPLFESGVVRPIIDTVFPFDQISEGHKRMEENKNVGKVVLNLEN